jgi:acetyltransferase-like isoleucine patch superfamily enzyme
MKMLRYSPSNWRPIRLGQYLLTYVKLLLYGVRFGRHLHLRGVTLLNCGRIEIGDHCRLVSHPNGSPEVTNLRTYFPTAIIRIGSHVGLSGTTLHCNVSITVGNYCRCGPGVILCDNDSHRVARSVEDRDQRPAEAPIVLGDNVWLGMRTIVLKGVTIGANTIVAAGSVVTRSLPANVVAGGVPARVIRSLD